MTRATSLLAVALFPDGPIGWSAGVPTWSEGEGYYVESIARRVAKVDLCTYAFESDSRWYASVSHYRFTVGNVGFTRLPQAPGENPGIISKIWQLIKVFIRIRGHIRQADVVYLFLPSFPSMLAMIWARIYRKPTVVYAASDWSKEESALMFRWQGIKRALLLPIFSRVNEWAERSMIRGAVFTLCAGRQARERFSAWSSRVHETVPRLNWPAMRTYGRDDTCTGPVVELLYVGGLYHRKGIRWLLEAMQMLNRRGERRFHLRLAGDGADRVEYEALRDHLGLTDAITFLGHVRSGPDLFRLYQEADIFVFPSLGEGFPRVLYEAMASSLPVVATAVNSIPLVMPSGERALLVPPQDAAALGEAVLRLSQDGDLRRCLIASGRSFMERIMSRSDGGQQFAELLSQYATATT